MKLAKPIMTFLGLCMVAIVAVLALYAPIQFLSATPTDTGVSLSPPTFFKSANAANLEEADWEFILEEAGVTAYTDIGDSLDIQFLAPNFKHIRKETDQYVMGIVYAPGYESLPEFDEKGEVQVLVHSDGWIVAYLTRWQTGAELYDWVNYDNARLTGTLVENTVKHLAEQLELSDVNVNYYDFRYPDATDLVLAADRADGITRVDSFSIEVPRDIDVLESTWSAAQFHVTGRCNGCSVTPGTCELNDEQLASLSPPWEKWRVYTGELTDENFPQAQEHTVIVGGIGQRAYCGVAIIYKETSP